MSTVEMGNDVAIDAQKFVEKASEKGLAEIEAARTAVEKAERDDVVEFARLMMHDHREANEQLKSIASQQGLKYEDDAPLMDKVKKAAMKVAPGDSFDRAYIHNQVSEHEKAIELFEQGSHTNDEKVSSFARRILPQLQTHLDHAHKLKAAIG